MFAPSGVGIAVGDRRATAASGRDACEVRPREERTAPPDLPSGSSPGGGTPVGEIPDTAGARVPHAVMGRDAARARRRVSSHARRAPLLLLRRVPSMFPEEVLKCAFGTAERSDVASCVVGDPRRGSATVLAARGLTTTRRAPPVFVGVVTCSRRAHPSETSKDLRTFAAAGATSIARRTTTAAAYVAAVSWFRSTHNTGSGRSATRRSSTTCSSSSSGCRASRSPAPGRT